MRLQLSLFATLLSVCAMATVHNVTVGSNFFNPSSLTIDQGDTVVWTNTGGSHNVNGTTTTFPSNPDSFGNSVGTGWTYQFKFTVPGTYNYQCDPHAPGMSGTITVQAVASNPDMIITGVADGPLSGGTPKVIEFYVINNISDLSVYGFGSANNGGGTDGEEFTFPAVSATAGDFIYVAGDSAGFYDFFGFDADYRNVNAALINGDDAVELFMNGNVVDIFGDINVDGSGQAWDYMDGWAYRLNGTGPDGSTFVLGNWTYSGINQLEGGTTNATCTSAFPIGTYSLSAAMPMVNFEMSSHTVMEDVGNVDVNLIINPTSSTDDTITLQAALGTNITVPGDGFITPAPNMTTGIFKLPVPANEDTVNFTITVVDDAVIEGNETLFVSMTSVTSGLTLGTITDFTFIVEDNDAPAPVVPVYTIDQITTVDANGDPDSLGVYCKTYGVVYTDDFGGGPSLSFYIYDHTGGVNVYSSSGVSNYSVTRGDSIMVMGEVGVYNGLTEIMVDSIEVIGQGITLKEPTVVPALDNESIEGEYIRLNGWWFVDTAQWTTGSGNGGFNVSITNGTDTTIMRISNAIDLYNMPVPAVDTFDVIGAGSQYTKNSPADDGYQIFPRDMHDIFAHTSGVNELAISGISLFPNPANGNVFIETQTGDTKTVKVIGLTGKVMKEFTTSDKRIEMNTFAWPKGVYLISVEMNGKHASRKLIVQ